MTKAVKDELGRQPGVEVGGGHGVCYSVVEDMGVVVVLILSREQQESRPDFFWRLRKIQIGIVKGREVVKASDVIVAYCFIYPRVWSRFVRCLSYSCYWTGNG